LTDLTFIGTSDAFGAGGRRQSAIFVRGERGALLLDCGATTNTGLSHLGIPRDEIDTILISHFHGDHFGGIPLFLFAALYIDERTRPLEIAGPPEIRQRVHELAHAMGHVLEDREWSFPIRYRELHSGETADVGPARIEAFATNHQLEAHPHGYRVDLGRELLVYSGDTGWFDALPGHVAGGDLFICECTQQHAGLDFHLSLEQLRERREQLDVGRLVLTHLGEEMAGLRGEIELETADDGLQLKL